MLKHKIGALLFLIVCCSVGSEARLRLCPGDFGVEGEWIYFLPSVDHPFFAAEGLETTENMRTSVKSKLLTNPFEFSSGYRVGGGFAFCGCDLDVQVRWTHLRTGSQDASSGDPSVIPLTDVLAGDLEIINTQLETNTHFTYDGLEGSFGTPLCLCSSLDLLLRLGVEYAAHEIRQEVSFSGTGFSPVNDKLQKKSQFWGVGPTVGFDSTYLFGCGVSLTGKVETSLLISRVEATRREFTVGNVAIHAGTDKIWRASPKLGVRLGLAYDLCLCNFALSTEVGYELLSYINALPYFADRVTIRTVTDYSNLDMHGLYVNLALKY